MSMTRRKFAATRPTQTPLQNPRAWWNHATISIRKYVASRHSTFTWPRIRRRRDLRKRYLALYRQVVMESLPSQESSTALEQ
eukprot:Pgem_evm1s5669